MEKIGINHPVVKLPTYRKMSVTTEEYELVLAHRKGIRERNEISSRLREIYIEARKAAAQYRREHETN